MRFVLALVAFLFTGCMTTSELQHCDEAIHHQIKSLENQGFSVVGGGDFVKAEGVILMGQFLNLEREEGVIAVTVDTEPLSEFFTEQKFKKESTCQRGGKEWVLFSKRDKVKVEAN